MWLLKTNSHKMTRNSVLNGCMPPSFDIQIAYSKNGNLEVLTGKKHKRDFKEKLCLIVDKPKHEFCNSPRQFFKKAKFTKETQEAHNKDFGGIIPKN